MSPTNGKHRPGWVTAGSATLTAAAVIIAGCGGGGGGGMTAGTASTEEATVHGTVTVKGAKPSGGTIYFDPSNPSRQSAAVVSAAIGTDGTYTLKTLVGENRVSVDTPATRKDADLSVPKPFEVKSGDNALDVTLPRP